MWCMRRLASLVWVLEPRTQINAFAFWHVWSFYGVHTMKLVSEEAQQRKSHQGWPNHKQGDPQITRPRQTDSSRKCSSQFSQESWKIKEVERDQWRNWPSQVAFFISYHINISSAHIPKKGRSLGWLYAHVFCIHIRYRFFGKNSAPLIQSMFQVQIQACSAKDDQVNWQEVAPPVLSLPESSCAGS